VKARFLRGGTVYANDSSVNHIDPRLPPLNPDWSIRFRLGDRLEDNEFDSYGSLGIIAFVNEITRRDVLDWLIRDDARSQDWMYWAN
jgi:hypothetical protein